jgi:membrane protein required for colicin V production
MTQFDYAILLVFLVSGFMGFLRGASREVVTVLALTFGAMGALFGLPFVGQLARKLVNPDWLGTVGAGIVLFLVIYAALRLVGGLAVQRIQRTQVLGVLDRSVGLAFGLVRAFVFIGALSLAFSAATPAERIPGWISNAKLYPMATASGRLLAAFAPKGRDLAQRMKPGLSEAARDSARDSGADGSYDARERRQIDDLVEKSR